MAFGPEVGSVTVRVHPNTKGFRKEAAAQLRALNKQLDEIVKVRINPKEVRDFIEKAVPKEVPSPEVKPPKLDAFQRRMRDELNKAVASIEARIPATLEGEHFRRDLAAKVKEAEQTVSAQISAEVELAAAQRAKMLAIVAELTAIARSKRIKIPVVVDVDRHGGFRAALAGLKGRLGRAAGLAVNGIGTGIRGVAAGAKVAATTIGKMTHAAWIAVAVMALAAPAVTLLSGALVALPGVLAGVIAPMGVVALGMDGIKKAAERAKPAFDSLKTTISGIFEQGMIPAFEKINNTLLPNLTQSMSTVAVSLSEAFGGIVDSLTEDANLAELQKLFNNVGVGIRKAIPGMQDFTAGMTNLIGTISQRFPDMGEAFSKMGADFKTWIAEVTDSGQLDTMLDNLRGVAGELGGLFKDIGKWGFETLADPKFGNALRGFAEDLRSLVNSTLPLLKSGFEDVAAIVSGIRSTVDAIKGASNWIEKVTGAEPPKYDQADQKKLWGWLSDFGIDNNANIVKWLGLERGGELAQAAKASGQEAGANLNKEFQIAVDTTRSSLQQTFSAGGMGQEGIGMAVSGQVDTAISAAMTRLQQFQGEFGGQLDTALAPLQLVPEKISTSLAGVPTTIVAGLQGGVAAVQDMSGRMIAALSSGLGGPMYQTVAAAFNGVSSAVAAGMNAATGAAAGGVAQILGALNAGLAAVPAVAQAWFGTLPTLIEGTMVQAVGGVANACQQIIDQMMRYTGPARSAGEAIGASFAEGLESQVGLVSAAASSLMGAARAFFPNSPADKGPFSGSGWVDKSGEAIGRDFAQGIANTSNLAGEEASKMAQTVIDGINGVMSEGVKVDVNLDPAFLEELKKEKDVLDLRAKTLGVQKDQAPDKMARAALQAELDQINARRREIGLMQEQADYQKKYGGEVEKTSEAYNLLMDSVQKIPTDFVKSTVGQFTSDLGMSGDGMIPDLIGQGVNYIFQVANLDEAISAQRVTQNRNSLQFG